LQGIAIFRSDAVTVTMRDVATQALAGGPTSLQESRQSDAGPMVRPAAFIAAPNPPMATQARVSLVPISSALSISAVWQFQISDRSKLQFRRKCSTPNTRFASPNSTLDTSTVGA
jgi:hypothetical protein